MKPKFVSLDNSLYFCSRESPGVIYRGISLLECETDYQSSIKRIRNMTERETNKIVSENLNYVKSVANQYRGNGVEFDDLVSEGTLAMIMAARKFDETKGSQFVAYASPFIRKAMQQAIDKQSALYRVPKDQKKYAPRNAAKAVSIDAPLSVGNQYTLLDILVNKDAKMADDNTAFTQMLSDLERCVEELDERDRTVISKFYGIGTAHETLAEIAEDLQLKRERVRQIRDKAIRQISKNATSKVLKHFLRK